MKRLSCTVSATMESIADVVETTGRLADQAGFSESGKFELLVALTEALNNILEHVIAPGSNSIIQVQARVSGNALIIRVRDHGRQMRTLPGIEMPEASAEQGRGWPIIASWTDAVRYRSLPGSNLLTLVKKIS